MWVDGVLQHRWCVVGVVVVVVLSSSSSSSSGARGPSCRPRPYCSIGDVPARFGAVSAVLPPFLVLAPPPPCAKFRLPPCPPWGLKGLLGFRNSWSRGPWRVPWYGQVPRGPLNLGPLEGPRLQRTLPFGGCPLLSCLLAGFGVASCCCVGYSARTLLPFRVVALPPPAPSTLNQYLKL